MPTETEPLVCVAGEPMMSYGQGTAPELNYNLPQTAQFTAYVLIPVAPPAGFAYKAEPGIGQGPAPSEGYFSVVGAATDAQIISAVVGHGAKQTTNAPVVSVAVDGKNDGVFAVEVSASPAGSFGNAIMNVVEGVEFDIADLGQFNIGGTSSARFVSMAKKNYPFTYTDMAGNEAAEWIPKPAQATPVVTIIEHYKVVTFLGDYGAGKTVKTFTLLPGEETVITVKTYKSTVKNQKEVENVLDSFTNESSKDLEEKVEQETGLNTSSSRSSVKTSSKSLGVNVAIPKSPITVNANASQNNTSTVASTRDESLKTLNSAIEKQFQKSTNTRKVEVNSETSATTTETDETTIVRNLRNVNQSRVLNFVFRQLNQQLITVTYLDDVTFTFSNGYPEYKRECRLDGLLEMLTALGVAPASAEDFYFDILTQLHNIVDYSGTVKSFIKEVTTNYTVLTPTGTTTAQHKIWVKDEDMLTTIPSSEIDGAAELKIPGIVKDIKLRVMPTDSVITEALLGQSDALDCFNAKIQDAESNRVRLENLQKEQAIGIIDELTTAADKATMYQKVFTPCCDTPQCTCAGHTTTTPPSPN